VLWGLGRHCLHLPASFFHSPLGGGGRFCFALVLPSLDLGHIDHDDDDGDDYHDDEDEDGDDDTTCYSS
jgi:hypothetical protein